MGKHSTAKTNGFPNSAPVTTPTRTSCRDRFSSSYFYIFLFAGESIRSSCARRSTSRTSNPSASCAIVRRHSGQRALLALSWTLSWRTIFFSFLVARIYYLISCRLYVMLVDVLDVSHLQSRVLRRFQHQLGSLRISQHL